MNTDAEIFKHIELLLGSIGFIIALFFGAFLIATHKQRDKANVFLAIYLLAFSLRIGKSLFFNYFPIHPVIRNVFLGMLLAIGPSLWLYVKYTHTPNSGIGKLQVVGHYLAIFLFVMFCWIIPNDKSDLSRFIFIGLLLHIVGYGVYTLYSLVAGKPYMSDLYPNKTTQYWLLYFVLLTLGMAFIQIAVFLQIAPYLSTAFLFSAVIVFLSIWGLKNPYLFRMQQEKYAGSTLSHQQASVYFDQLQSLMEEERLFLDPDLTLAKISARLRITTKQLSQVINQVQSQNYSQYVASFRINEAKRLLALPEYQQYKIAAIAYESGFNSISSFNTAFKRLTNITAVEYRRSISK